MKTIKKLASTLALAGIIIIGVSSAKAGIIVSLSETSKSETPCTETIDSKVEHGIIVSLTGIIVSLTGIIVSYKDVPSTDCGIIVSRK